MLAFLHSYMYQKLFGEISIGIFFELLYVFFDSF